MVIFLQPCSDKEKIMIIFTTCYLHFYTNFTFENTFSFDEYFNQNLINLCTKYNVYIKDIKQFKIFCYSYYYQLIKEIKNLNYPKFKQMYEYFSPLALDIYCNKLSNENEKISSRLSFLNNLKSLKSYITNVISGDKYKKIMRNIVNNKIFTPLISTTERVVDMVLSVNIFITIRLTLRQYAPPRITWIIWRLSRKKYQSIHLLKWTQLILKFYLKVIPVN